MSLFRLRTGFGAVFFCEIEGNSLRGLELRVLLVREIGFELCVWLVGLRFEEFVLKVDGVSPNVIVNCCLFGHVWRGR